MAYARVDEIFDEINGSKVLTTIDLFQRYWQIKMDEMCKEKTTFVCRYGTYQFEMMPFGLVNSGVTFQRMMNNILASVINVKCYIDDVVIHSATEEERIVHLDTVLKLLRKHGLRLRLKKCFFMQDCVQLLGQYEDKDGVTKYITEVVGRELTLVGSRGDGSTENSSNPSTSVSEKEIVNNSVENSTEIDDLPF